MHEIVTIQVGAQANYLGTHFWNTQESYFTYDAQEPSPIEHDIHFHQGIGADGADTYTPRALVYDFKQNFGTLRRINELYNALGDDDNGPAPTAAAHRQPPIPPHPYQVELNSGDQPAPIRADSIRYWSDFNRVFYNPRSIVQVYEDALEPQQRAFAQFADGEALYAELARHADFVDDELRPLVEQCDQMQGMQMLTGVDDGWGGFAARYMDAVRDEYDKATVVVCGLNRPAPDSSARRWSWSTNQARALHRLADSSSMYLPLSSTPSHMPSAFASPSTHPWFASAMQTLAFESSLLQTRMRVTATRIGDVAQRLTAEAGQKVIETSFEMHNGETALGTAAAPDDRCCLLPRSVSHSQAFEGAVEMKRGAGAAAAEDDPAPEDVEGTERFYSEVAFPVLSSFPQLANGANSVTVSARLGKTSAIGEWVQSLQEIAGRQVGVEDREELLDGLSQIKAAYRAEDDDDSSE